MKRRAKSSDQEAARSVSCGQSASYHLGGFRLPVYHPETRFTLTAKGRQELDKHNAPRR